MDSVKEVTDKKEDVQQGDVSEDTTTSQEREPENQIENDNDLHELSNERESPVLHDESIGQIGQQPSTVGVIPISSQPSPDQLSDLQSYLVTFNKEIGHGGQPSGFTIGPVGEIDANNLTGQTRQLIYNVSGSQILTVPANLQASDTTAVSSDTKHQIVMTSTSNLDPQDGLDPQSQTLKLAESLSDSGVILQQTNQVVGHNELSALNLHEQQRTVMLQGLPGAEGTLVQVDLPGPSSRKVLPVVSLDGKEHIQLIDSASVTTVVPQIINVSHPAETITQPGMSPMKTDEGETSTNDQEMESLPGIRIGQADITNAQIISLQNTDGTNNQLVTVNNAQDIQMLGTNESDPAAANFQSVTIVPTSSEQGGEMNYVLIVSQPDEEKGGVSSKQYALDMSLFDFKDGRQVIEDGSRKIIKLDNKKFDLTPLTVTQLQCHYCNYTAPKRYLLMRHMKTHSEDRPYQCNLCDKSFKTHASLQNHVNTHTGVRPHKCKDCEMAFTTSGELVRHIRYKHTFEKPHKCTECDYASVELSKLKRHMRSHTGERPYQCPHCQYASPDTYKLKRHLRIHTGEKPYECDVCHARFTQSNSLKAHKLIHSGLKPVFQCELCPTTCGRKTDLKIHMMKLHSNDKPVECKKCGMCFQDRYSFKLHLKSHDGEKCFKCDQCEYAALSQRHLESHLLTHTGEKPFECDECEQTFRQKQLLKRHKNLYHTPDYNRPEPKEKTFECDFCDKTFANRGNLLRHMQNHDPEYWNKKLSDGANNVMSTEDLIQGSLLNDMRDGKLGAAPKVVIVHPNGSVEEVTSRLQTLVAEKQMEEMMVEVVQDGSSTAVTTHSLEEAIRSQVAAVIQSHALKTIEVNKAGSGDDSATDNLTIDLDSHPQTETNTESLSGSKTDGKTTGTVLPWKMYESDANKPPDHIIVVKPKDKADVMDNFTKTVGGDNSSLQTEEGNLFMEVEQDESQTASNLSESIVSQSETENELEMDENSNT